MNVLDLFSGIGGFSLGLERAGMRTVAFCEIDPFCRQVLAKHWPHVPCYDDVRSLTAERLATDGISVDVICGGFPCQDISVAGRGAGIEGERSGLWSEYARIIGEVRPRYVIVENVAALLGRGLDRVLGDLAALGLNAEWHCIPASAVGAPHRRDRVWIVAYSSCPERWPLRGARGARRGLARQDSLSQRQKGSGRSESSGETLPYTDNQNQHAFAIDAEMASTQEHARDANCPRLSPSWSQPVRTYWQQSGGIFASADWWRTEPDVGRVAHGVPARVDCLRSLGNAVVPQIPEIIGRAIMNLANIHD